MRDKCKDDGGLDDIEKGLKDLFHAQLLVGRELVKLLGGAGDVARGLSKMRLPRGHSCCEVPEPCWMPLALGEIRCKLKPGDSGTVCLVVTNGDFRPHNYQFVAAGRSAANVTFSQNAATLGPKERIAVTANFTVPKDDRLPEDCRCIDHEALIWVRGCRNHYLRWVVDEVARSEACCKEVEVHDDPDYVLHWHDHFYQPKPCFGPAVVGGGRT